MSLATDTQRTSGEPGLNLRSTLGQVTQRAPRRLGQWAASVLFIVLVVVGLVALFQSQSDRAEVLVVRQPVAAGQIIQANDVEPAEVGGVLNAIVASDVESVIGQRAAAGLVEGQVLTESALSQTLVPAAGERLVAIRLEMGRVPGRLAPGDLVDVLVVPPAGDPGTTEQLDAPFRLAQSVRVDSMGETPDSAVVVTVLVKEAEANAIAAHSAAGQVTVVQAPAAGE
ncbi:SAF domain-containing protein [Brevibacterium sp. Mu109]|uniref:SAF domain-containing protein n=1 Tax=Brevibacterium sp. Mu109 TaxID=1255669 RepID=UPI000C364930|nr:SAF domain-containing protein [Brevibacterium sp. Mu109]SMX95323.1 SAF domain-containing protein [Brevibacterium sp. Mu109]